MTYLIAALLLIPLAVVLLAWNHGRSIPRTVVLLMLAGIALVWYANAHAFTPYTPERRVNNGPIVVEWTEAPGPTNCPAAVWKANPVMAVLGSGILFVYMECAIYQTGKCEIVSSGSDYELGHEFRHCYDGEWHHPMLFFMEYE